MNPIEVFKEEVRCNIAGLAGDKDVQALSRIWIREIARHRYAYNFTWLGRPVIQFPQDMLAIQELIWSVKPDVVIETGVAHGGSILFSASMLELVGGEGYVIGIDIDIRKHNRAEIEAHPHSKRVRLIEGSSIDEGVVNQVREMVGDGKVVLVILDSNHTHEHVLRELELFSPFVGEGSYLVVYDTLIEDMPADLVGDRPWGPGNNPKTAVWEFLAGSDRFRVDKDLEAKLLITVAPDGYLKCIRD
jgi:cephalosporin hydroxylase